MRNFKTILSLLLVTILLGGASSCKKDDPRVMTYTIADIGTGISGTVTFTEDVDNDHTMIMVTLNGLTAGGTYDTHLHAGSIASYTPAPSHDIGEITASAAGSGSRSMDFDQDFDYFTNYDCIFAAHDGTGAVVSAAEAGKL